MYARITRLVKSVYLAKKVKSVYDPVSLHIRSSSDIRKNLHPHPHPCIICSALNAIKKSGLGNGRGINCSDPIHFHPYIDQPPPPIVAANARGCSSLLLPQSSSLPTDNFTYGQKLEHGPALLIDFYGCFVLSRVQFLGGINEVVVAMSH